MQYVCLVYLVEKDMNAMTKKESDTCIDESLAYDDALRKAGHLIIAHALQPVEAATTIRGPERQAVRYRWSFRRDERTAGRAHADRGPGPERHHPGGCEEPHGPARQHRGSTDQRAPPLRRMR